MVYIKLEGAGSTYMRGRGEVVDEGSSWWKEEGKIGGWFEGEGELMREVPGWIDMRAGSTYTRGERAVPGGGEGKCEVTQSRCNPSCFCNGMRTT